MNIDSRNNRKTILYIRVSTLDQHTDRQDQEIESWAQRQGVENYQVISEKVSGSIPAADRKLSQIWKREVYVVKSNATKRVLS